MSKDVWIAPTVRVQTPAMPRIIPLVSTARTMSVVQVAVVMMSVLTVIQSVEEVEALVCVAVELPQIVRLDTTV